MPSKDSPLLSALKIAIKSERSPSETERARVQLEKALEDLRNPDAEANARGVADYFFKRSRRRQLGEPLSPPFGHLPSLRPAGLTKSAEFAFLEMLGDATPPPLEAALRCAPTAKSIEAWRQAVARSVKDRANNECPPPPEDADLIQLALDSPEAALRSGLGEWAVEKIDPSRLVDTLPLFAAAERENSRTVREDLLHKAIARDRSGTFLVRFLREVATTEGQLRATATAIREEARSLERALTILPTALLGDEDGRLGLLAIDLVAGGTHSKSSERRAASGRMIAFFGALISTEATSEGLEVAIRGLEDQFRKTDEAATDDKVIRDRPWVVRRGGNISSVKDNGDASSLTLAQATTICIAIEKLRTQPQGLAIIEAMAANLGLGYFGTEKEKVVFDPLLHEDTVGGMLPGESAQVVHSGWKLGEAVILRAPVE